MNKYDDIEQLLEKLARENPKEMDNIDDIDDAIFDRIEAKAMMSIAAQKPKKGYRFLLKAVAALVVLFGLFSLALYMFDMENTRATEDPTNIPEETVLYEAHAINFPEYIPEGYNMEYVTPHLYKNEYQGYEIKYVNSVDDSLFILIRVYGDPLKYDKELKNESLEYSLNDMPLLLNKVYSSPIVIYAEFSDGWNDIVQIAATLDEDTLMKVIESMH